MEKLRKKIRSRCFRKVIIYFLTWCMVMNTSLPAVLASPTGGTFVAGTGGAAIINQAVDNVTDVTVAGMQSVIEWTSLDTVGGLPADRESLNFFDGGHAGAAVLNRVISGLGTQFNGDLNAVEGMRIFMVNPAGIVFGNGSTVNVTQLIASGLDVADPTYGDFLTGRYEFVAGGTGTGIVTNESGLTEGGIHAAEGVALIGEQVINRGTITTDLGGFVVMAAGDRVLLGSPGSKIIVEMDSATFTEDGIGDVVNEGVITAPEGEVVLAAGDIFSLPLHPQLRFNSGTVDEPVYNDVVADQPVRVESGIGTVTQSGTINADGGSVVLTAGEDVILAADSTTRAVDGEVLAYAYDFGTKEATTSFEEGAVINIGTGTAEISGNHILFAGSVDAAPEGTIQVDPLTLTIADTMPGTGPDLDTLYEEDIESYSQDGVNLDLAADELITVEYMADGEITGGSGDIYLRNIYADGGIYFEQGQTGFRSSIRTEAYYESKTVYRDGGNIDMDAGSGGIVAGDLFTGVTSSDKMSQPGEIVLRTANGGDIEVGTMQAEGANRTQISAISDGDLIVNGDVESINKQPDNEETSVFKAIMCLIAEGDIDLNGNSYSVIAHGKDEVSADIRISAGENVYIGSDSEGNLASITAESKVSGAATHSTAHIVIHAGRNLDGSGVISINGQTYDPGEVYLLDGGITAKAWPGPLSIDTDGTPTTVGTESVWEDTGAPPAEFFAKIEINSNAPDLGPCEGCPQPPGLPPVPTLFIIFDDIVTFEKNVENKYVDVLDNDDDGDELEDGIVWEYTTTTAGGILEELPGGGDVTSFEYTPPENAVFVWVEGTDYAEFTDTFTYKAKDADGHISVNTATVTITVKNFLPVGGSTDILESKNVDPITVQESVATYLFDIGSDPDGDPVSIVPGSVTTTIGTVISEIEEDGKVVGFNYQPDLSAASFDQATGETTDYAQISYDVTDGYNTSTVETEGIVDIDLYNLFPVGGSTDILESKNVDPIAVQEGSVATYLFDIGSDPDSDPVSIVPGSITTTIGTITSEIEEDGKVIGFNYEPDLSAASFDQTTGETTGYAQISYDVTDGYNTSTVETEGIVDIDLYNLFPVGGSTDILESKNVDPIAVQEGSVVTYSFDIGSDPDGDLVSIVPGSITTATGTITQIEEDGKVIGFNYQSDLSAASFDQTTGETTDYAQISYDVTDGYNTSTVETEGIVDIDLYNLFPVADGGFATTPKTDNIDVTEATASVRDYIEFVLGSDLDPEDSIWIHSFESPTHGTLTPIYEVPGDPTSHIIGFNYDPPDDFSAAIFDSTGFDDEFDLFTYTVTDGYNYSTPTLEHPGLIVINLRDVLPPVALPNMQPAPGLQREVIEISGCPSLMQWAASELGTDESQIQVWVANSLASDRGIMPCDACANLKQAATVLQDVDGARVAALAGMINEFASSTAPPTEEQMASIADAIANDIEGNSQYAAAGEYLDALAEYVGILTSEMGFSADESIQFATDNYVGQLAQGEDMGVAVYVAARLAALAGSE